MRGRVSIRTALAAMLFVAGLQIPIEAGETESVPSRISSPPDVAPAADVVVLSRGRRKPLLTQARETVASLIDVNGGDPLVTYLSLIFESEAWFHEKCLVPGRELSDRLFTGQDVVSPHEVEEAFRQELHEPIRREILRLRAARAHGRTVDAGELAALETIWEQYGILLTKWQGIRFGINDELYNFIEDNFRYQFRCFPDPTSTEGWWLTLAEAQQALTTGPEALRAGVTAYEGCRTSFLAGDSEGFSEHVAALKAAQRSLGAQDSNPILPDSLVRVELLYYAVDFKMVGLILFALCGLLYATYALRTTRSFLLGAYVTLGAGILWNCWIVGGHTAIAGRLPLKNLNEVYLVVLFFVPLIGALLDFLLKNPVYSGMSVALCIVGFVGSHFLKADGYVITPLVAILQSPWREVHILTIMLSYAILLVAFGLHAAFLTVTWLGRGRRVLSDGTIEYSPLATDLNRNAYHVVAWGFLFLTIAHDTVAHTSFGSQPQ